MERARIDCLDLNRKFALRNLKSAILLGAMLFALCVPVAAQEPAKVWRIGVLVSSSASLNASRDEALRQGLREMGYVEGKNIIMEFRYAEGKLDRLSELAADLVRSRPDLILVGGTRVAVAAKQATGTIPIVVAGAGGLVAAGVVHNLNRPGGNDRGVQAVPGNSRHASGASQRSHSKGHAHSNSLES